MPGPGTRQQRGYDEPHQRARRRWQPVVDAGDAYCAEPVCLLETEGGDRWIEPGTPWDLAHDSSDPTRTTYLGPAHRRCNRSEGASRGNRLRGRADQPHGAPGTRRNWEL